MLLATVLFLVFASADAGGAAVAPGRRVVAGEAAVAPGPRIAARSSWRRPVPGAVTRPFAYGADPFRSGWHRGIDLAASPGAVARAACTGVVMTARPGLLTLRCGPWRVTHLPLAAVSVTVGASVRAGRAVGVVGTSGEHRGLHLGVRREGDRFAYVDPLPFLAGRATPPPTAPPPRTVRVPRSGPGGPRPVAPPAPVPTSPPAAVPVAPPTAVPASPRVSVPASPPAAEPVSPLDGVPASPPVAVPALPPAPLRAAPPDAVRVSSPADVRGLAPWPAWAGLGLLLLGAAGSGIRVRVRRRRVPATAAVPSTR